MYTIVYLGLQHIEYRVFDNKTKEVGESKAH